MENDQIDAMIARQPEALSLGTAVPSYAKSDKAMPAQAPIEAPQEMSLRHPSPFCGVSGAAPIDTSEARAPTASDRPELPSLFDPAGLLEFEVLWSEPDVRAADIAKLYGYDVRSLDRLRRDLGLSPRRARTGTGSWTRPLAETHRLMRRALLGSRMSTGGRKLMAEAHARRVEREQRRRTAAALEAQKRLADAMARMITGKSLASINRWTTRLGT